MTRSEIEARADYYQLQCCHFGLRFYQDIIRNGSQVIQDGTCRLEKSSSRKPDLMIRTPAEVWLGVTRGELDGQQAFFQKTYQAEGDLGLLIRMKILFSGGVALTGGRIQNAKAGLPK